MSIPDGIIQAAVNSGLLYPVIPRAKGTSVRRPMFLTEELKRAFESEYLDQAWEERMGALEAELDTFVNGDLLTPKYLFLLTPTRDRIWEIRSTKEDPSIRVLVQFAQKDVLIATHYELRSDLNGWDSQEWKKAKRRAGAIWRNIFPAYNSLGSTNIHDLVTGAINGKWFKKL